MKRGPHKKRKKRTNCIMLRLTDSEFSIVSEQAEKNRQPLAVYMREIALCRSFSARAPISISISDLQPLVTEFGRIGNNLNQIAKYYHTGGMKSMEIESEIKRCIQTLFQLRAQLVKLEEEINGNLKTYIK